MKNAFYGVISTCGAGEEIIDKIEISVHRNYTNRNTKK